MKKILNYTPHEIIIITDDEVIKIASSGIARVSAVTEKIGDINGVPLIITHFGEVEGLPAYSNDTFIVVSSLVKSACPSRDDLVVPAEYTRDEDGKITGCRALSR